MGRQTEILNNKQVHSNVEWRLKRQNLLESTFVRERVEKTAKAHTCERCNMEIPAGSYAMRIIPIEKGKKDFAKVEYFHLKNNCPAWSK